MLLAYWGFCRVRRHFPVRTAHATKVNHVFPLHVSADNKRLTLVSANKQMYVRYATERLHTSVAYVRLQAYVGVDRSRYTYTARGGVLSLLITAPPIGNQVFQQLRGIR